MTRRSLFTGLVGAVSAAALAARTPDAASDDFMYRGYRVHWGGWRVPLNQFITFGAWVAYRDGSPYLTYATTLGGYVDHAAKEMDQIDLSYKHGWPHPSDVRGELATQEQRDAVKHRALHALLEKL